MKAVESAGLVKFDFLGLKTLTMLQTAVEFLKRKGVDLDLSALPLDDTKTFDLLCRAEAVGVFQLESSGMQALLRQAKPRAFEDIIALISLYRPGPMDNIPDYVAVRDGRKPADYLHPLLEPSLKETAGIMIYQEQVMEAARLLAGYSLGGADLLRRAMGKKIQAEMDKQRAGFIEGCAATNGISAELASEIFDQIDKFAGYGFNKSHAAAYALISYQTAWLKAHHPVEFLAASMALDVDNSDKLNVFKRECERMGVELLPPDVNLSGANFTVEGGAVRFALGGVKGVGITAMQALAEEREKTGRFRDLFDFAERLDARILNKRQMENLAKSGAFDSLEPNRRKVFESVEMICRYGITRQEEKSSSQVSLFGGSPGTQLPRPKLADVHDWPALDKLKNEFEAFGYYMSAHPLDSFGTVLRRLGVMASAKAAESLEYEGAGPRRMAGVVLGRTEKRSAKGNKFAWVQLSDATGGFEAMAFSEVLMQHRELFEAGKTLLVDVTIEKRDEDISFLINRAELLEAAAARSSKGMEIRLANGEPAARLAEILGGADKGKGRVSLILEIDEGSERVSIDLPGGIRPEPGLRAALAAVPGVLEVEEL
jgi:DNA polymerase-3 subunit alpha